MKKKEKKRKKIIFKGVITLPMTIKYEKLYNDVTFIIFLLENKQ